MTYPKRTKTCGELRPSDTGARVTLNGWVDGRRDLGGLIFVDVRDRHGKTQVVFDPASPGGAHAAASGLRSEFVVSVSGTVRARPAASLNTSLPTGGVEVVADALTVLNEAETPPFPIADKLDAFEELRLRYRYLDLRRPVMQRNLLMRHAMYGVTRSYFDRMGFVEVETPILMKSTPEGARDYLVPSRVHHGKFYALPQSPQTYKQILMVAGMDRYFQIVKCFRDEDLRADRQPEFTQIDVEMSFVDESDVMAMAEGLMVRMMKEVAGVEVAAPFERLTYADAQATYGSDKPDLRIDLKIVTLTAEVKGSEFKPFSQVPAGPDGRAGVVAGLRGPGCASFSRSRIDQLTELVKKAGASGLVSLKVTDAGVEGSAAKHIGEPMLAKIAALCAAKPGDMLFIVSGPPDDAYGALGALRLELGRSLSLVSKGHRFLWVTDFPLFSKDPSRDRLDAVHHPFTAPGAGDEGLLDSNPLAVRARAYDLVLNGNEIAGGSIRIHNQAMQSRVFSLLGIGEAEARAKFGFMLDAFRYGAPPHGGIAFGFDRICMLLAGQDSIRDVIAFPKTTSASSLMDDAPSEVAPEQLKELHLRIER